MGWSLALYALMDSSFWFDTINLSIVTCNDLAKAGLVVGPPSVRTTLGVPSLCNL